MTNQPADITTYKVTTWPLGLHCLAGQQIVLNKTQCEVKLTHPNSTTYRINHNRLLLVFTCVARMNACRSTSGEVTSVERDEKTDALLCVLPSKSSRLVSSLRRLFSL